MKDRLGGRKIGKSLIMILKVIVMESQSLMELMISKETKGSSMLVCHQIPPNLLLTVYGSGGGILDINIIPILIDF